MKGAMRLRRDPRLFGKLLLGADLWPTQQEILQAIATHRRVAVKACHASGKTYAIAVAVLWWIITHSDGIAVTTAPTWLQVEKLIWGEILHQLSCLRGTGRMVLPKPNKTELTIAPGNYALGLSTDDSMRFQGFHAGKVLVVLDEAPGVREEIYQAVEGISAGGDVHVLALGNPLHAGGPFYNAFTSDRARWKTITIDAFNTPNLHGLSLEQLRTLPPDLPESHALFTHAPRPYLVTRRWVYETFLKYGEDSPFWQARVRGQFPDQGEDALISLKWLEAARVAKQQADNAPLFAGVDVAGPGEDETVLTIRRGACVIFQKSWVGERSSGHVLAEMAKFGGPSAFRAVNIDSAGLGEYFCEIIEASSYLVNAVNVGTVSADPGRFSLLKGELYWSLRERFEAGEISGLNDELAISQLASIRYKHDLRGRVVIESKEDMKKRGVSSPDRAESLMLCFADQTPIALDWIREQVEAAQGARGYDDRPAISQRAPLPTRPVEEEKIDDNPLIDEYYRVQNEILTREDAQRNSRINRECPVTSDTGWTPPGFKRR